MLVIWRLPLQDVEFLVPSSISQQLPAHTKKVYYFGNCLLFVFTAAAQVLSTVYDLSADSW